MARGRTLILRLDPDTAAFHVRILEDNRSGWAAVTRETLGTADDPEALFTDVVMRAGADLDGIPLEPLKL